MFHELWEIPELEIRKLQGSGDPPPKNSPEKSEMGSEFRDAIGTWGEISENRGGGSPVPGNNSGNYSAGIKTSLVEPPAGHSANLVEDA
jgi:hypothetical protein